MSCKRNSNNLWVPPSISDDDSTRDVDYDSDDNHSVNEPKPSQLVKAIDLVILREPENQHRARYLSEGSRGAIKDKSGNSFCTVQLVGYNRATCLEVFAASVSDPVMPHPFYRIVPVNGKNNGTPTTPCEPSITVDNIACIRTVLRPDNKMTAKLDCIGILKLCSHDLKRRAGQGKRDTCIRLALRATLVKNDPITGDPKSISVQKLTGPISCVQKMGHPEVHKISLSSTSVNGGQELFILGKNFEKNVVVVFKEYNSEGRLIWNTEAPLDKQTLHQCHIVCTVPTFRDLSVQSGVEVTLTIQCGNKFSHPVPFTYLPVKEKTALEMSHVPVDSPNLESIIQMLASPNDASDVHKNWSQPDTDTNKKRRVEICTTSESDQLDQPFSQSSHLAYNGDNSWIL